MCLFSENASKLSQLIGPNILLTVVVSRIWRKEIAKQMFHSSNLSYVTDDISISIQLNLAKTISRAEDSEAAGALADP